MSETVCRRSSPCRQLRRLQGASQAFRTRTKPLPIKALAQPFELRRVDFIQRLSRPRAAKSRLLQTAHAQPHAGGVAPHRLDPRTRPIAEHVGRTVEGVTLEHGPHQHQQTIDTAAQIHRLTASHPLEGRSISAGPTARPPAKPDRSRQAPEARHRQSIPSSSDSAGAVGQTCSGTNAGTAAAEPDADDSRRRQSSND